MKSGDLLSAAFIGFMAGAAFWMILDIMTGSLHFDHVRDYNACLALGAPQQNCFDKYLVEKKQ